MKEDIRNYFNSITLMQKLENNSNIKFGFIYLTEIDKHIVTFKRSNTLLEIRVSNSNIKIKIEFSTLNLRDEFYHDYMKILFNEKNYSNKGEISNHGLLGFREEFQNADLFKDFFYKFVVNYWG